MRARELSEFAEGSRRQPVAAEALGQKQPEPRAGTAVRQAVEW